MEIKKNLNPDRILVLSPIDGKAPLTSIGTTDPRLFTGENKLHAVKDLQTCLWSCKFEMGVVPPYLKQQFTTFNALRKTVEDYYKKRNVQIKEVID